MRILTGHHLNSCLSFLADCMSATSPTARRDALCLMLGLHGLRVGEVVGLKKNDLLGTGVWVRTLKGGPPRLVPLRDGMRQAIERESKRWRGPYLFSSRTGRPLATSHLRRFATRVPVPFFHLHALRHTCGQRIYDETGDLQLVQTLLGHSSLQMAQVYARCSGKKGLEVMPELPIRQEVVQLNLFSELLDGKHPTLAG